MKLLSIILSLLVINSVYSQANTRSANSTTTGSRYQTSEGHTMVVIAGPVTFIMGSPENEALRDTGEVQHTVIIPRTFAIATKEITVEQFQRFLDENPAIKERAGKDSSKSPLADNKKLLQFSPDKQCPQIFVTWYEAAAYCNWLSKKEGIPEDQWCYPPLEQIGSVMWLPEDYLHRKGYRLPTEAEWEYACRAGTTTSHFFDPTGDSLSDYAWFSKNPPRKRSDPINPSDPHHTHPVGQLKPNPFGLYDIYGNVWEWCGTQRRPYRKETVVDNEESRLMITDSVAMVRRGGSYSYGRETTRSAHRGDATYFPGQRRDNVGFRIARTLTAANSQ
jgi:formylglycine-generating enzyme required for sulfatase activity